MTSTCRHEERLRVEDIHTGDTVCTGCALVVEERRAAEVADLEKSALNSHPGEGKRNTSDLAFRMALSEACHLMGLPAVNLLVDQCMENFTKYCKDLNYENKTFPTKKPVLAYAFHRTLADKAIYRLPCFFAGLFDLPAKRLLQAEKLVCQASNLTPLYVPPSLLIESVCRWLHLKPPLALACRDLCLKVEATHFGKNPESIMYAVLQAVSNRLPLIYPHSGQIIDMNEVRNVFRMSARARIFRLDPLIADVHLRRRPI